MQWRPLASAIKGPYRRRRINWDTVLATAIIAVPAAYIVWRLLTK